MLVSTIQDPKAKTAAQSSISAHDDPIVLTLIIVSLGSAMPTVVSVL
jgi:hypothetical protein